MKSVVAQASTIAKAIDAAWQKAENPEEFFTRVLQEPQTSFLGFNTQKAKVVLFFKNSDKSNSPMPVVLKQKDYSDLFNNKSLKISDDEVKHQSKPAQKNKNNNQKPQQNDRNKQGHAKQKPRRAHNLSKDQHNKKDQKSSQPVLKKENPSIHSHKKQEASSLPKQKQEPKKTVNKMKRRPLVQKPNEAPSGIKKAKKPEDKK